MKSLVLLWGESPEVACRISNPEFPKLEPSRLQGEICEFLFHSWFRYLLYFCEKLQMLN